MDLICLQRIGLVELYDCLCFALLRSDTQAAQLALHNFGLTERTQPLISAIADLGRIQMELREEPQSGGVHRAHSGPEKEPES